MEFKFSYFQNNDIFYPLIYDLNETFIDVLIYINVSIISLYIFYEVFSIKFKCNRFLK